MIAVIADDFTGAAEIGGVGLKRGLNVVIETEVSGVENTDVLVIVADTRSLEVQKAKAKIESLTAQLLQLNPRFIFKKIDSVLRGNVYEELISQQQVEDKNRVVVIPANPHFNRIIKNNIYYINDIPLVETSFAHDPEFPVKSSNVCEIIGTNPALIQCLNATDQLPEKGFIVGNVGTIQDLLLWANKMDDETVYAGGSGFFETILKKEHLQKDCAEKLGAHNARHSLFIFGSMFPKPADLLKKMEMAGAMFINLSEDYFSADDSDLYPNREEIAEDVALWLGLGRKVVITTVFKDCKEAGITPDQVRTEIGLIVKSVFDLIEIQELYIEGGATASQILHNLNITRLKPVKELDHGIIEMEVGNYPDLNLITKPGSYQWPDSVFSKNN